MVTVIKSFPLYKLLAELMAYYNWSCVARITPRGGKSSVAEMGSHVKRCWRATSMKKSTSYENKWWCSAWFEGLSSGSGTRLELRKSWFGFHFCHSSSLTLSLGVCQLNSAFLSESSSATLNSISSISTASFLRQEPAPAVWLYNGFSALGLLS